MKKTKKKKKTTPTIGHWGHNAEERLRLGKKYEEVSLTALKPWRENPRFNEDAVPKVAALIKEHGWAGVIVATPDGVIRAGHTRYAAARMLGMQTVQVHWRNFATPQAAEDYALADNKAGEWADWDSGKLAKLFKQRAKVNLVKLERITGFSRQDIDFFRNPDTVEESKSKPLVVPAWFQLAAEYAYLRGCKRAGKKPRAWATVKEREVDRLQTWLDKRGS